RQTHPTNHRTGIETTSIPTTAVCRCPRLRSTCVANALGENGVEEDGSCCLVDETARGLEQRAAKEECEKRRGARRCPTYASAPVAQSVTTMSPPGCPDSRSGSHQCVTCSAADRMGKQ